MAGLDDLSRNEIEDLKRRLRILETAAPLQNASIGANGLRVYGGGGITIENGGLSVTGSATVVGTLNADGTINMTGLFIASGEMRLNGTTIATGDFNIDGPLIVDGNTTFNGTLDITGITNIEGDTTITGKLVTDGPVDINGLTKITGDVTVTGNLDLEGTTSLKGDLNVIGDGKIVAGQTTIRPSGVINFGATLTISPAGEFGPASISDGMAKYVLTPGDAVYFHQFQGGGYFDGRLRASDLRLSNLPTTSEPANLHIDGEGFVKRSTA